ncbi:MAG: hypothetical protein NUW22_04985 [Acidobacteria bacterium]|nr:hypothetical protein [Acidobacteriota bacterium]
MTTTALAPVERHELALDRPATAVEIRAQVNLIQEVMKAVMMDGVHFGTIPGTPKPTLYKPGSEKILSTFRIAIEPIVADLSTHDEARYRVETRATSQATGMYLGSGTGEASSNEEKYRWRKAVCQEEFDATPEDRRRSVWKKGQNGAYQIPQVRTNHADVANTILKMAKKRSQIDVTLTVTAASDVFAQDIEDLPEGVREAVASEEGARPAAKPPVQAPQRKSQSTAPAGNLASCKVKVSGLQSKDGESEKGPWRKWAFKGSDGKWYSTFDTIVSTTLREAEEGGDVVELTFTEDKYGRNIKTIAIVSREPGAEG